ncbi:MAG: HXXEE domain-containing protein [Methanobacterium sp.]|nr:HXXEE domain-containing protein [Methanobacterium sp.]
MVNWLYRNWAKLSVLLAIVVAIIIFVLIKPENIVIFLIWIQIPIYLLHQFEEHAGDGFKNYINRKVFLVEEGDFPLNDKNIFWINIPIIWILMPIFASLSSLNVMFGLWIPYFAVFNSLSHVIFSIRSREYNPGLIVSIVLGIPVGIYALIIFYSYIAVPTIISILSIVFALMLHLIIFGYIKMKYNKKN